MKSDKGFDLAQRLVHPYEPFINTLMLDLTNQIGKNHVKIETSFVVVESGCAWEACLGGIRH